MKRSLLVIVILSLINNSLKAQSNDSNPENGEECEVFVFRDKFALVWDMGIKVDGVKYLKFNDKSYGQFYVENGDHEIKASWNFLAGGVDLPTNVNCQGSENIYLAFQGNHDGICRTIEAFRITEIEAQERIKTYKKVELRPSK